MDQEHGVQTTDMESGFGALILRGLIDKAFLQCVGSIDTRRQMALAAGSGLIDEAFPQCVGSIETPTQMALVTGLIDESEFLQWVARIQSLTEEVEGASGDTADDITKDLVAAFRVFDRDCNGYITKDELKTAMDMIGETVTDVQLNEMLAIADIDKDGKINYEEFARLLL
uniref:EF-hand domain-containing protein n=1 Tax=Timema cristinae TaxID=61476 RepID=A0A7R9D3V8_TIMCR|nr:unnamed protein product [Timema cristinae]